MIRIFNKEIKNTKVLQTILSFYKRSLKGKHEVLVCLVQLSFTKHSNLFGGGCLLKYNNQI